MTKARRRQAGEGGISEYRTAAGTKYLAKYGALNPDGTRRVVLKRGFATRQEAARYLREQLAKVDRGEVTSRTTRITVEELCGQWLELGCPGRKRGTKSQSTVASYRKNIRLHVVPHIGGVQVRNLTGGRLDKLYLQLLATGRHDGKGGLSPRTVQYVHTIISAALEYARRQHIINRNPAQDAERVPAGEETKPPEMRPWTAEQLGAFLSWAWATNARHAAALHVLAYTGMRRGECLALRWSDIDFDRARLAVRRSVGVVKGEGHGERLVEGPTKGKRSRTVDLDPGTVEVLRKWRVERAALSLQLARDDALIFGDLEGGHLHPERFSRQFREKVAQCRSGRHPLPEDQAPPSIHLHDLRHTHATLLLQAGEHVKVVSERLGHATVMITLETYAHVMPGMQAEAAARFAALVGGGAQ